MNTECCQEMGREKLRDALRCFPRAFSLFDEVYGLFGNTLKVSVCGTKDGGSLAYEPSADSQKLWHAVMATSLEPWTIAHETEHLKLFANGYPVMTERPDLNRAFDQSLGDFQARGRDILVRFESQKILYRHARDLENHVQHLLFFQHFLDLGFDRRDFVRNSRFELDCIKKQAEICRTDEPNKPYARGWFNAECFVEMVYRRLGYESQVCEQDEQELMRIGRTVSEKVDEDQLFMKDWLEKGAFRCSSQYASSLNELLSQIGYEPVKFSRLWQVKAEGILMCPA